MQHDQYPCEKSFTMVNPVYQTIDDSHTAIEEEDEKRTDIIFNRFICCLIAICLLWATSLRICVQIVNSNITIPKLTSVVDTCSQTYEITQRENSIYRKCANSQLQVCTKYLDLAYQDEVKRTSHAQDYNNLFAHDFDILQTNCSSSLQLTKSVINGWTNAGVYNQIPYQKNSTPAQQHEVNAILGSSGSNSKVSSYSESSQFAQTSNTNVNHLTNYAGQVNSYNSWYVQNKTKELQSLSFSIVNKVSIPAIAGLKDSFEPMYSMLNSLLACVSLSNTTGAVCELGVNTRALYQQVEGFTNVRIGTIEAGIAALNLQFNQYIQEVEVAIQNADNFYLSVKGPLGIINYVNAFVPGGLCGHSSPDFCSFSMSDWYVPVPVIQTIKPALLVPDASTLWNPVIEAFNVALSQIVTSSLALNVGLSNWYSSLLSGIQLADFSPDDYQPPEYTYRTNASVTYSDQKTASTNFLNQMNQLLLPSNQSVQTVVASVTQPLLNATVTTSQSLFSTFQSKWAQFSVSSLNLYDLLLTLLDINNLLYLFDYIYRGVLTLRLISKFWNRGVVKLPVVNIESRTTDFHSSTMVYIQYALEALPYLWVILAFILGLLIVIIWLIAAVLVPEMMTYSSACVHHVTNSTFLSRNLNSAAFNYATMTGSGDIQSGLADYNQQSVSYCNFKQSSTQASYLQTLNRLVNTNTSLSNNIVDMDLLESAIDLPTLDRWFLAACCGWTVTPSLSPGNYYLPTTAQASSNYRNTSTCQSLATKYQCPVDSSYGKTSRIALYKVPSSYFGSSICSVNITLSALPVLHNAHYRLTNSVFQCDALPPCTITCNGPDRDVLEASTKVCSCMVQWYFNGFILQIALALIVFIILNLSRLLVVKGLIRLFWRKLSPKVFVLTANCDEDGVILLKGSPNNVIEVDRRREKTVSSCPPPDAKRVDKVEPSVKKPKKSVSFAMKDDRNERLEEGGCDAAEVGSSGSGGSSGEVVLEATTIHEINERNAHCSLCSHICYHSWNHSHDKSPLESTIKEKLSGLILKYERMAWVYMGVGVIINVPWILALIFVNSNLLYKQS